MLLNANFSAEKDEQNEAHLSLKGNEFAQEIGAKVSAEVNAENIK